MKKLRREGEIWPFFYFSAWYDYAMLSDVCYPIGIHLLARLLRFLKFKYFKLFVHSRRNELENQIYLAGQASGYNAGRLEAEKLLSVLNKIHNKINERK